MTKTLGLLEEVKQKVNQIERKEIRKNLKNQRKSDRNEQKKNMKKMISLMKTTRMKTKMKMIPATKTIQTMKIHSENRQKKASICMIHITRDGRLEIVNA